MHETMSFIFYEHVSSRTTVSLQEFIDQFNTIHENLWLQYREGKLKKNILRDQRFYLTLLKFNIKDIELSKKLNNLYLEICPLKTNLFPHTLEVLDYLKEKYSLYILTNGFIETQKRKIEGCGLQEYFKHIFSSEEIGYSKPHIKIFARAVNSINARKKECLMIGDDPIVDISGARDYGIDQFFFNPQGNQTDVHPTREIKSLKELLTIL